MSTPPPFTGPVPWAAFVEWTRVPADYEKHVATRGDFVLTVWWDRERWAYRVEFQGMQAAHGFARDQGDEGRKACQRTAVKMAAFHGMPIDERFGVAHLLVGPNDGGTRRVAFDGPSPKMRARAAASRTPTEPAIAAVVDEDEG